MLNHENKILEKLQCEHCLHIFKHASSYSRHKKSCKIKYQSENYIILTKKGEILEKKGEILEKKEEYESIKELQIKYNILNHKYELLNEILISGNIPYKRVMQIKEIIWDLEKKAT